MANFIPKDYVPVHTRVQKMHDENEQCSVQTQYTLLWDKDTVVFQATVITSKWSYNWTSFGSIEKDKALEKLETVAVWRALAFAWYEIQSWLASEDEMERFAKKQEGELNEDARDDKPRFNDKEFEQFVKSYRDGEIWPLSDKFRFDTIDEAKSFIKKKYRLSKKMEDKVVQILWSKKK